MNERIAKVRKESGMTQAAFAKSIGLSANFVWMLEKGERIPSDRTISDICREFGVSEQWLRTGEGEMNVPRTRDEEIADFVADVMTAEPDDIRVRLIAVMSRLTAEDWAFIAKRARELKEELDKAEQEKTGP